MGNPLVDILVALFALGAFIAMVGRLSGSSPYDRIGAGGTSLPSDPLEAIDALEVPGGEQTQRESEIRQMLQARSERLVRMGHPPLDVEAEVSKALAELE